MASGNELKLASYVFDDVEVDSASLHVQKGGSRRKITPRGFDVLLYLLEHRGRLVEKQELFEKVWKERFVTDNALTRVIKEIRQVIGDAAESPQYIETVPKRGYRFIAHVIETETVFDTARTVSDTPTPARTNVAHRGLMLISVAVVVIAAAAFGFFYFTSPSNVVDSIAVLPIVNADNNPETEYLSDGITESIISNLSQLPQLRVMARATVFRFKGQEIDPKEVGRQLGVKAVMVGRMQQLKERLIINTELVRVSDGAQIWGAKYDRNSSEALAIEQEIAREISEKLRLRVTVEEKKRLTGRETTNAEAYQFYLRGRYFWNKRTADGIRKAIELFQQAIQRDPNFALGYVGLADCFLLLEQYAGVPNSESMPQARAAVDRALQLDELSAEAHTSLSIIYQKMWRWDEAERENRRAISLNPNYATAHHWFTVYFATKRQFDDALREIKLAQELDPLSPIINEVAGYTYLLKNEIELGVEQVKKSLELDPNFPGAHRILGYAYLKQQRYDEATAEFEKAVELSARGSEALGELGYCYGIRGKHAQARRILQELEEKYKKHESPGYQVAAVYVGLDDKDHAFQWLEKDFQQHSGRLPNITLRFPFDNLRSDPRYGDLVRRMGLDPN